MAIDNNLADRLLKMKSLIEESRTQAAKLEGSLTELYNQLKKEHGFETIEEAQDFLIKLEEEIKEKEDFLKKKIPELEDKLNAITDI